MRSISLSIKVYDKFNYGELSRTWAAAEINSFYSYFFIIKVVKTT